MSDRITIVLRFLILLSFLAYVFYVLETIKVMNTNNQLATSESVDTKHFTVVDTFTDGVVLLKNEQEELFKVESESVYYHVIGFQLSKIALDSKIYKDVTYYYFKDIRVILEKI